MRKIALFVFFLFPLFCNAQYSANGNSFGRPFQQDYTVNVGQAYTYANPAFQFNCYFDKNIGYPADYTQTVTNANGLVPSYELDDDSIYYHAIYKYFGVPLTATTTTVDIVGCYGGFGNNTYSKIENVHIIATSSLSNNIASTVINYSTSSPSMPSNISYGDWIFVNIVIIFILSFGALGILFAVLRPKK